MILSSRNLKARGEGSERDENQHYCTLRMEGVNIDSAIFTEFYSVYITYLFPKPGAQ